jgi:hypothetical protein
VIGPPFICPWRRTGRQPLRFRGVFPQTELVIHPKNRQLGSDHNKRKVSALNPGFSQGAVNQDIVQILSIIAPLTAAVQKQQHRPELLRICLITRRQIK